ncbi:CRISPR-associated endonuclease Cas1 [Pyrofollis japonicus]|nr:CRISPR-associated endonuclease Cas1 [Pyrofollis japonicus]
MGEVFVVSTPGARVFVRSGVVYVQAPGSDPVPVTYDAELVLLATGAVSISGRALRRLAELGIRVLVLGHRGHVVAEYRPIDRVNKTVEARMAQYEAKLRGDALRYAAEMVRAKIVNQARVLRYISKSRREPWIRDEAYRVEDEAYELSKLVKSGSLDADRVRGVEARAAKKYWQVLAALLPGDYGFTGRNPRGEDAVNMAISYAYAILYGVAYDALIVVGLDPYAGFLHADRSGRVSLVYDYSDTFKPLIDRVLFTNIDPALFDSYKGSLSYESRRKIAERVTNALTSQVKDFEGKKRPLRDHVYAYAWSLAKALREKTQYRAFIAVI